jgi:hypothetical protein
VQDEAERSEVEFDLAVLVLVVEDRDAIDLAAVVAGEHRIFARGFDGPLLVALSGMKVLPMLDAIASRPPRGESLLFLVTGALPPDSRVVPVHFKEAQRWLFVYLDAPVDEPDVVETGHQFKPIIGE